MRSSTLFSILALVLAPAAFVTAQDAGSLEGRENVEALRDIVKRRIVKELEARLVEKRDGGLMVPHGPHHGGSIGGSRTRMPGTRSLHDGLQDLEARRGSAGHGEGSDEGGSHRRHRRDGGLMVPHGPHHGGSIGGSRTRMPGTRSLHEDSDLSQRDGLMLPHGPHHGGSIEGSRTRMPGTRSLHEDLAARWEHGGAGHGHWRHRQDSDLSQRDGLMVPHGPHHGGSIGGSRTRMPGTRSLHEDSDLSQRDGLMLPHGPHHGGSIEGSRTRMPGTRSLHDDLAARWGHGGEGHGHWRHRQDSDLSQRDGLMVPHGPHHGGSIEGSRTRMPGTRSLHEDSDLSQRDGLMVPHGPHHGGSIEGSRTRMPGTRSLHDVELLPLENKIPVQPHHIGMRMPAGRLVARAHGGHGEHREHREHHEHEGRRRMKNRLPKEMPTDTDTSSTQSDQTSTRGLEELLERSYIEVEELD